MTLPAVLPENHLTDLKRLALRLEADCRPIFDWPRGGYTATALIALLNLARRGLVPTVIRGGGAILLEMIRLEMSEQDFFAATGQLAIVPARTRLDDTAFAARCCQFLLPLEALDQNQCHRLLQVLKKQSAALSRKPGQLLAIAADGLAAGWAHEYLSEKESGANILSRTQFFTPGWIGAYLCAEVMAKKKNFCLLDPACGAGHLLVQALRLATAETTAEQLPQQMAQILGNSIYGLDVDPGLLGLAAFGLYICARDLLAESLSEQPFLDLPGPALFCLEQPLGSLALRQLDSLSTFTGEKKPASVLPQTYDAIVMNPPYLSTRTMDDTTAGYLRENYGDCSGDLYTAFMQLAMSLLKPGGRLATIVQQSFLSITRYRQFRLQLLEQSNIVSCVQLGTGAFPSRPGEKVNNAIVTLQKRLPDNNNNDDDFVMRYLRLNNKNNHIDAKSKGMSQLPHKSISRLEALKLISLLPGQAFAFHCPAEVAELFSNEPSLADLKQDFVLTNGLFTCDNKRFVKLADQVNDEEAPLYVPYDKGGGHKWYHQTPYRLNWGVDGQAIRDFRFERGQSRGLPGEAFYFKPGLTYSYIGTRGFSARLLSAGAVFDIASSAVFSLKYDLHYVLGFLNSALVAYMLGVLNPTINFQIGDLRKLPFKKPDSQLQSEIAKLAREAVTTVKLMQEQKNTHPEGLRELAERENTIQKQIDHLLFEHYAVSNAARIEILEDTWVQHGRKLLV